jgi:hypothetical protein
LPAPPSCLPGIHADSAWFLAADLIVVYYMLF